MIGALSPIGVAIGVVTSNTIPQRALELTFAGLALLIAAQLVFQFVPLLRAGSPVGPLVNLMLFVVMVVGLGLSLWRRGVSVAQV